MQQDDLCAFVVYFLLAAAWKQVPGHACRHTLNRSGSPYERGYGTRPLMTPRQPERTPDRRGSQKHPRSSAIKKMCPSTGTGLKISLPREPARARHDISNRPVTRSLRG